MTTEAIQDGPGAAPPGAHPAYRALVERLFSLSRGGMKLGLDPMARLLTDLGHPEQAFRAVHVAGSNGKGSTTAFLSTALSAAGRFVGMYTSPHLISMTERVQFLRHAQNHQVSQTAMVRAVDRVEAVAPGFGGLSFFEVITGAALEVFRQAEIEIAVIEAGLGARLDATRLVNAEVAVLTDLSLEHTAILGDTIEEIAREEGAVVRPKKPLVCADGPTAAMREVDALARAAQAPVYRLGEDFAAERMPDGRFALTLADRRLPPIRLALLGPHQGRNAALAAQAAILAEPGITDEALVAGLTHARWPGRMETVQTVRGSILLDGAQNAHATRALAEALRIHAHRFSGPLHFVFGVMSDKDARAMLESLAPLARSITVTRPSSIRARAPEAVASLIPAGPEVRIETSIQGALDHAQNAAAADDGWVVVCGSLYLIGDVRALLGLR